MGNSKFWLHPYASGAATEIDIGATISDVQANPVHNQSVSEGMTGQLNRTRFNSRMMVRIVEENYTSAALIRAFYLLEDHLKGGGLVAFAVDASQAWAGYARNIPTRGDTTIEVVNESIWPYQSNPAMASGENVELLSNQPRCFRELRSTSITITGPTLLLGEGLEYSYREEGCTWVLARHGGFYPALRLPKEGLGDTLVTHDHGISYTFDAQLEEAIDALDAFAGVPSITTTGTTVNFTRGESLGTHTAYTDGFSSDSGGAVTYIPPGLGDGVGPR